MYAKRPAEVQQEGPEDIRSPPMTVKAQQLAANQYAISRKSSTAKTARSASLPGSKVPFLFSNFSANAPLMVAAAIASAGDMRIWVQASDRTNGILGVGEDPGL